MVKVRYRWSIVRIGLISIMLLLVSPSVFSATVLKLASTAPQNSPWGKILESISARFGEVTDGEIELRIFHNGIAGHEADVVRKMRLGQIDIGVFTSIGISEIDDSVITLSIPGLITSADELDYILDRFGPALQQEINETPYEVLGWAGIGWVYPFTSIPVRNPEDIRRVKLAVSVGNEELTQLYRDIGYDPVPLAFSEVLSGLNSGLIGGLIASPTAAAGFQWFGIANNMVNVQLAPFLGGIIVSDRAWKKIDSQYKGRLRAVVHQHLGELTKESLEVEVRSIATMKRFGLDVVELSESERQDWKEYYDIDKYADNNVKELLDLRLYNLIRNALAQYRSQQ